MATNQVPQPDAGVASFASSDPYAGREVFSGDTPVTSAGEVVGELQELPIYSVVGRDSAGQIRLATYETAGGVSATGTLTLTANVTAGDTMTIGGKVYTFRSALTDGGLPNEILISAVDASGTIDNMIAAINEAAGEGTLYGNGTEQNEYASAAAGAGDTMTLTAREIGTAGNDVALTETFTGGGNVFSATPMSGGTDFTGDGIKAMGITTCAVAVAVGATDKIDVYRSGMFNPDALNWHASFDTDEKKRKAFEGGASPNIFIQKMRYQEPTS